MVRIPDAACATLCLASAFVAGCAVDGADEQALAIHECAPIPKGRVDRDLLEAIDAMGLCGSSAVDAGDGYVVEDDIFIAKSTLRDKQARTSSLVSSANVHQITVRVDASIPASGVDDWRSAVQTAIAAWNAVPFSSVTFALTHDSTADITILADSGALADNALAQATFPSGGVAGYRIRINLDFLSDTTMTESQKIHTAAHEIGHCIGFRHTNWASLGEASAIQIAGTPTTDAESVMNGGTPLDDWMGLTSNDDLALRTVYPDAVGLNVEYTGCTSGTPRMSAVWGGTFSHAAVQWQLDRYVNSAWTSVYDGTSHPNWTFLVPTGQQLKLRARARTTEGWLAYRTNTQTAPSCSTLPP